MATPTRERTVAFYEIVSRADGVQTPFDEHLDWSGMLEDLEKRELKDRVCEADRQLIGAATSWDGTRHFVLHKVKDKADWLSLANFAKGTVTEVEAKAGEGYLDTSVVCFAGFGNIIAMMEGSTSAPSHRAVELWLTRLSGFKVDFAVRPLMSAGEFEKFENADAVQRIEIKTSTRLRLKGKKGALATSFRALRKAYGDASLTITVSAPRGAPKKGQEDVRERLYADLEEFSDQLSSTDRARIGLLYAEDDSYGRARVTELVEHHITAKRKVPAVDAEGRSIRIAGAIQAMTSELTSHEAELRAAVSGSE